MPFCRNCHASPIPPGNRRYCAECSPLAVKLWRRRHPRISMTEFKRSAAKGEPPYLDYWQSREAYRAYFRQYMREWRAGKRSTTARRGQQDGEVPA